MYIAHSTCIKLMQNDFSNCILCVPGNAQRADLFWSISRVFQHKQ